jgi:hypothetical protein
MKEVETMEAEIESSTLSAELREPLTIAAAQTFNSFNFQRQRAHFETGEIPKARDEGWHLAL